MLTANTQCMYLEQATFSTAQQVIVIVINQQATNCNCNYLGAPESLIVIIIVIVKPQAIVIVINSLQKLQLPITDLNIVIVETWYTVSFLAGGGAAD